MILPSFYFLWNSLLQITNFSIDTINLSSIKLMKIEKLDSCVISADFDASRSTDFDMDLSQCIQGWSFISFCKFQFFLSFHIQVETSLGDTCIQCRFNHFKRWVFNPHLFVNWTFPSSDRFWLAVGASRPPEILRGLRNLGTPSLNSKNLLLTTRWIYQTSLSKSNYTNLLKLKNSPMKSWWQSEMHRGMRFKIVIWDQVRVPTWIWPSSN